jgi:hypothetical protein
LTSWGVHHWGIETALLELARWAFTAEKHT